MTKNNILQPRIVFFSVKDTQSKLMKIASIARSHFEKKEPLVIFVPDGAALEFVDNLLWRLPEESFLPHTATDTICEDLIVLTTLKENLNEAHAAFNLCPAPLLLKDSFKIIYELEDHTSPEKKEFSSQRYQAYREAGFSIASL